MRIIGPAPIIGKVSTAQIDDDAITEAKVANDAIGISELKAGIDGNVISFDASGDPVMIATGNDSQVLTSAGAGAQPAFEDAAGSPLEFVSSTTASNTAAIEITGIDNSADTWMVLIEGVNPATDAQEIRLRTSNDTSSHSYDSGGSDYGWSFFGIYGSADTGYNKHDTADSEIQIGKDPFYPGNDTTSAWSGNLIIHNPSVTTYHTMISFDITMQGSSQESHRLVGSGHRIAAEAVTAIQLTCGSGNFDTGKFSLFKIKHA